MKISRKRCVRLLGVFLAAVLLVSTLPAAGLTASAVKMKGAFFLSGDPAFAYVVTGIKPEDSDNTVKLYQNADMQSYAGYTGTYTIPARAYDADDMRFYTVTEIGGAVGDTIPGALQNVALRGVSLPDTLTTIGARAFAGCTALTEMTFPTSVTDVASSAFNGVNLQKLTLNVVEAATMSGDMSYVPARKAASVLLPGRVTDLVVSAPLTISGQVSVSNSVKLSNSGITLQGGSSLSLDGSLSGTGVIEVRNAASLRLGGESTGYSGSIRLTGLSSAFTNTGSLPVTVLNTRGRAVTVLPGESVLGGEENIPDQPDEPDTPDVPAVLQPKISYNYGGTVAVANSGKVVVISAYEGYHVEKVVVNGLTMGAITRYEFEAASDENTVEVTFAQGKIPEGPEGPSAFVDIPSNASYKDAVAFLSNNGIFQGVSKNQFAPGQQATRAMFLSLLHRMEIYGEDFHVTPEVKVGVPSDVAESAWYAEDVTWAIGSHIVMPDLNWRFYPNTLITREEACLWLYRYTRQRGYAAFVEASRYHAYSDAILLGGESRTAMSWAATNGYLPVKRTVLNPAGTLTRAEIAEMLARYLQEN